MSIKSNLTENLKNANEESSVSLLQAYCNSRITDSKESKDSNYYKKFFFDVKNIIFPENDKNIKTSIRTQLIDRIKILLEEKTENVKKENEENENKISEEEKNENEKNEKKKFVDEKKTNNKRKSYKKILLNFNLADNYNKDYFSQYNLSPVKKFEGKEYYKYKKINPSLKKIENLIRYNLFNSSEKIKKNNYNQNKYRNLNSKIINYNFMNSLSYRNNLYQRNIKYNSIKSKYNKNRLLFNY
jgi:hypothetical protein